MNSMVNLKVKYISKNASNNIQSLSFFLCMVRRVDLNKYLYSKVIFEVLYFSFFSSINERIARTFNLFFCFFSSMNSLLVSLILSRSFLLCGRHFCHGQIKMFLGQVFLSCQITLLWNSVLGHHRPCGPGHINLLFAIVFFD